MYAGVIELTNIFYSLGWRFERLVKPQIGIYYCCMNEKGESSDRVWYILRDLSIQGLCRLGYLKAVPSNDEDVFLTNRSKELVESDLLGLSPWWGWSVEVTPSSAEDYVDPSLRLYHL